MPFPLTQRSRRRGVETRLVIEGVSDRFIGHRLPLAFLAPEVIEAILAGTQPAEVSLRSLIRRVELPLDWAGQKRLLGLG